ncbi:MAG TPA: hypothetical protein VD996_11600 [Chitinophagaceae bacterium]|nr:hypothetical protein [Chitinophagaceae bacterium]
MKQLFCLSAIAAVCCAFLFCGNASTAGDALAGSANDGLDTVRPTGMIAYIRNDQEIRLIDSNGLNDRQIWTHANAKGQMGIYDLAWKPDGRELAFSSGHEAAHSLYAADIYCIRPDGTGLRKITNAPDHKAFAKYKQGSVSITFRNMQYSFDRAQSSYGVFIVSIAGAKEPQQITLPPGATKTVVFKEVADFGNVAQPIVATWGNYRWFMPGTDVIAGKSTKAPDFTISGDGIQYFGAYRPMWKNDGSEISYRDGLCLVKRIPANPQTGVHHYQPLFGESYPAGSCVWDWGPTAATKNQVLYSENESEDGSAFYITKEGGNHDPAARQTLFSDLKYQIANDVRWLPDGSGFVYSSTSISTEDGSHLSNLFLYNIRTRQTKQLTNLKGVYARKFCISPSGQWIVYEQCKKTNVAEDYMLDIQNLTDVDLWMIRTDGTGEKLLVKNGLGPSWSR